MGIIQDTIQAKAAKNLEPAALDNDPSEEKVEEVIAEIRKEVSGDFGQLSVIARTTGVSEEKVKEIFEEMDTKLNE